MHNKKGMTLIEVIVSIMLLGVIAAGILPAFPNTLKMLVGTREMTNNIYEAQEKMENEIAEVKGKIKNGDTINGGSSYGIFNGSDRRIVTGYLREVDVKDTAYLSSSNSKKVYSVVADTYKAQLPVATINSVTTTIEGISSNDTGCYADTASMYLSTQIDISDPEAVNLTNIYKWYASNEGYYISPKENPDESEKGTAYPIFPNDYSIIPNENTSMLSNRLSSYAGRYIVCSVTPASRSGKMGTTVASNPIYFSGLTVTDGLMLHLDTSMLDQYNSNALSISGNTSKVKTIRSLNNKSLYASANMANMPQYMQDQLIKRNETNEYTYLKYMRFVGNEYIKTNKYFYSRNPDGFTAFVLVRGMSGNNKLIINEGNDWSIGLDENGYIYFKAWNTTLGTSFTATDTNWHIIRVSYKNQTLSLSYDQNEPVTVNYNGWRDYFYDYITLGNGITGDIGEAIVYSSISDVDISKVESYLINKYSIH